jgi:hypothetical protein
VTKDEALKEALDTLKHVEDVYCITYEEAMSALEEALAQPEQEQEPECPECKAVVLYECVACSNNNYPPQRQPLTGEQMELLIEDIAEWSRYVEVDTAPQTLEKHVRQVLAAHAKGENT